MANELQVIGQLSFTKSPAASITIGSSAAAQFSVTGSKYTRGVQNIATSAEVIELGDVGTPGWFYIKNLDPTNFVTILSGVAGAALLKLKPNEWAIGRFGVAAPAAQADTAACNIEYLIIED